MSANGSTIVCSICIARTHAVIHYNAPMADCCSALNTCALSLSAPVFSVRAVFKSNYNYSNTKRPLPFWRWFFVNFIYNPI